MRTWQKCLLRWTMWSARQCRVLWYRMRSSLSVHGVPQLFQPLHAVGQGRVTFTGRVKLGCLSTTEGVSAKTYIEARSWRAFVCIGHNTSIDSGFAAIAEQTSILIGSNVRIGKQVHIFDSERTLTHRRGSLACRPVVVEDDVVIGAHVRICGGARIRRGARIASHSVITADVPEHTVFAGHPARLICHIRPQSWLPRHHLFHGSRIRRA